MPSAILRAALAGTVCVLLLSACGGDHDDTPAAVPADIASVMAKPRYADAGSTWSLVVIDARTGELLQSLDPDRLSLTGSVRKLFSVGAALDTIGPDHRFETGVYRVGEAPVGGNLAGDLVLVASGDLTLGGRAKADGTLDFTDFDHNEAPSFGGAGLTPEDPLAGLDDLARQVAASGVRRVRGDVVVDDRLFDSFRVPNGNTLISPIELNENLIDVTVTPAASAGAPAAVDWRPRLSGFTVAGSVLTSAPGSPADLSLSGDTASTISLTCLDAPGCQGVLANAGATGPATLPVGYVTPVLGTTQFVGVLKAEDPPTFARIAFIDALARAGVAVDAPTVARNDATRLPARESLTAVTRVANFASPPYAEIARLILKVSLNTGANLSLVHAGLSQGQRTVATALAAERRLLADDLGLDPAGFDFPTNGSGSPDSRASARTTARLLQTMSGKPFYAAYRGALPVLGTDGSLAAVGRDVVGKEHMSLKSGATVEGGQIVAISMAGYIEARSGRALTFAVFVNHAGPLTGLQDTLDVFEDEATIAGIVYRQF